MIDESTKDLRDYLTALRRRRPLILMVSAGLLLVTLLVAFLLPPRYQSSATILIEEQEIPPDLVRSTITTYAWQRIQTISQRVMTRSNLLDIVEKYDLYHDKRRRETSEQIVERMHEDIKLVPETFDVIDPRTGRPTPATIAFTLAFEGSSPTVTQKVTTELTNLYLDENVKSRTERVKDTYDFLTEEATKLRDHITELETNLAVFKEKNVNRLPELAQLNMQLMDRTERELMDVYNQARSLEERKFYLEGQLAQLNPSSPMFTDSGERVLDTSSRLKVLKSELASAQAKYSDDHPDVLRLQREVDGLQQQAGATGKARERKRDQAKELGRMRAELAAAREKYSEEHPDVIRLNREIASLEGTLKQPIEPAPEVSVALETPDNPAYISIQSQLEGINSQINAMAAKQRELKQRLGDYEKRIVQTPQVEREYLNLKRDYENSQLRYQEIRAKQMEAQVGKELEKERKGERFTLIDPPQLPEQPVKPNRPVIILLGLILSIGGGIGVGVVAEALDNSLRGGRSVAAILGAAPLAVIPYMENSLDLARRAAAKKAAMWSATVGLIIAVVLIQFLWIPWDVLWFKGLRALGGVVGS